MNKFINILLGLLLFPTMVVAIFVGFDLPVEFLKVSGRNLPYRNEIFLGLGLMIFIVILRRSIRRWMGMRIVNQVKKFKWNQVVSVERKKRVQTYQIMEAVVMFSIGTGLFAIAPEAIAPAIAFWVGALDNIIFMLVGSNDKFRVGVSSKAVIVADREVVLLYFTGLRKISAHQQTTYFDYIKGLQLSFPTNCIDDAYKNDFYEALEAQVDHDRVFFSKTTK